jgi:hypothetical protein
MLGEVPDVRDGDRADHGRSRQPVLGGHVRPPQMLAALAAALATTHGDNRLTAGVRTAHHIHNDRGPET